MLEINKPKKNYYILDNDASSHPSTLTEDFAYLSANKLKNKCAIITGGDSGIGAAVAIAFAKEGADIGIVYYENDEDALIVKKRIKELGRQVYLYKGDMGDEKVVKSAIDFLSKNLIL